MLKHYDNEWYVVAPAHCINTKKPFRLKFMGRQFVLWRDNNGSINALDDRCPHVGASLSGGRIVDSNVVCPYHGLRFSGQGHCTHIPAEPKSKRVPKGMRTRRWSVREQDDWIYLFWGEADATKPSLPSLSRQTVLDKSAVNHSARDWPAHFTQAVENSLDPLHFAEAHRHLHVPVSREEDIVFIQRDRCIEGVRPDDSADFTASLLYPNLWYQSIGRWGVASIAFVPETATSTRLYLRTAVTNPAIPGVKQLFGYMMHKLYSFALWQDYKIVTEQTPPPEGSNDLLLGYDKMIIAYRKMRAKRVPRYGRHETASVSSASR
jgi:nitrite reductase/ring-hydroxylating ferredoxin subunit